MNFLESMFQKDNVEIRVFDKSGNAKTLFQDNRLFRFLMKHGLVSPLAPKIPFLFGHKTLVKTNHNVVVNGARAVISARIYGTSSAAFASIGLGTGVTAASASDTALQTGVTTGGAGDSGVHAIPTASVTWSSVTTTLTNDTAQAVGTATFTATVAVTESGVFNADTNGVMFAHQVFSAINVVSGDSIQFTWKFKNA